MLSCRLREQIHSSEDDLVSGDIPSVPHIAVIGEVYEDRKINIMIESELVVRDLKHFSDCFTDCFTVVVFRHGINVKSYTIIQ